MTRVAIIGAGMAGLACARRLVDAGLAPVIFDKGHGIGGRLATRRIDGLQFDHGAQYVTARNDAFAAVLQNMQAVGAAALWADGSGRPRIVGVPGMSALPRTLAIRLDVRQLAPVAAVRAHATGWSVHMGDGAQEFDRVVITVPAPQIAGLLGEEHPLVAQLVDVRFAPCLTLMAALDAPPAFVSRSDASDALAWIASDNSKPGRPNGVSTWVAQASPEFSVQYLAADTATNTARMLPLLCDKLGVAATQVTYANTHRWRYARVTKPLGQPFLRSSKTLYVGGDWCIGPRVEAAWASGDAVARDILEHLV
jgi:renalase